MRLSLRWLLALAFLTLAVALMAAYSFLSAHYFMRGLDSATLLTLEQHIQAARQRADDPKGAHAVGQRLMVSQRWQDMPALVRELWPEPPAQAGRLLKARHGQLHEGGPPARMVFLLRENNAQDAPLFASMVIESPHESARVIKNHQQNQQLLIFMALALLATAGLLLLALLRGVFNPLARLQHWTDTLTPESLQQSAPDFYYPELNQLAELIRSSLLSVQQSVAREQRFIRHASHELRTPISVIRSNLALVWRLLEREHASRAAVERIDRASRTMKDLTETLLWLGRSQDEPLECTAVELASEIQQWQQELNYLLQNKDIRLNITTEAGSYCLPHTALRIVVTNLLRNAIQHTWQGSIEVQQSGLSIRITNQGELADQTQPNTGYGLGLELVEQLCERLGWCYQVACHKDTYTSHLQLLEHTTTATEKR